MSVIKAEDPSSDEEKVFFLRRGGMSPTDIARQLDMTTTQVVDLYNSYRLKVGKHALKRDEARDLMVARYEGLVDTYYSAAINGDQEAFENVIKVLKDESKILQLDQLDPADRQVTQNILIIGDDRASFIEALREGRGDVVTGETIEGEEVTDE